MSVQVSGGPTARPATTSASQARLVSQAWNTQEGQVRPPVSSDNLVLSFHSTPDYFFLSRCDWWAGRL